MGLFFSSSSFNKAKSIICFNNNLVGKCASCTYMNPKNYLSGFFSGYKYHCVLKGGYYPWDDRPCRSLVEVDPEKVDCAERYYNFTGRRYFILTAIFEILGFNLDNRMYTEIKSLIDSVREDEATKVDAIEYDIVGMDIANCLRNDENRIEVCNDLFKNYLIKIYSLVVLKQKEEAVTLYREMVKNLYIRYRNMDNYSELIDAKRLETPKLKIK